MFRSRGSRQSRFGQRSPFKRVLGVFVGLVAALVASARAGEAVHEAAALRLATMRFGPQGL